MNRKGFLQMAPLALIALGIAIVIIVFGIAFGFKILFSTKYLFYAIGISVIVMTFVYAVPALLSGRMTGQKRNFVLFLFLIGAVFIVLPLTGVIQQTALDAGYIQIPLKGYYECAPASAPVISPEKALPASFTAISCPPNTDKCDLVIRKSETLGLFDLGRQIEYTRNGIATLVKPTGTYRDAFEVRITNVAKGEQISVAYEKEGLFGKGTPVAGAVYSAQYNPFVLWKTSPTGGRNEYSPVAQGCDFRAGETAKLIVSDTLGFGTGSSSSLDVLEPFKTRNFIDVIVPASVENAKIQGDKYCSNKQLFQIDQVETPIAAYKVVNTNKVVGTVSCCSGDIEPGIRQCVNNAWVDLPKPNTQPAPGQGIQCSLFQPCGGSDFTPYSDKQLVRSVCENSVCVQKTKDVQCTRNSGCSDPNKPVCDTLSYTCVAAPAPQGEGTIVPKSGNGNVTQEACDAKAAANPIAGYTFVQSQTTSCDFVCSVSFGLNKPTVTTTAECKAGNVPYIALVAVILVLGISAMLLLRKPRRRKR